jgi:GDPmannose 4,6-dehydratase
LQLCHGDLTDSASIGHLLAMVRPDEVYNLGSQSQVNISFEIPEYTANVTGLGAVRLLEALREQNLPARYFQAASSEMFGQMTDQPQDENTPFHPRSPYAAAKVFAFHMTRNYREAHGMFAVNGLLFNHESPRRDEAFVTRKITRACRRYRAWKTPMPPPGQPRLAARLGIRRRLRRSDVANAPGSRAR